MGLEMAQSILVVDDEPKIVALIKGYLEASGFTVIPAFEGGGPLRGGREDQVHHARGGVVAFGVDDSGPGIAPEERERVFERFYRVDKSRAAKTGGRGLGLAIASEIVKAHGGSIAIGDSSLGGASFTVTLPRYGS
jgi:signal transduction histidine kinase